MRAVCVVGLGLIGGSLLRAAAASGRRVWGTTSSDADAAAAAQDGFATAELEAALRQAADENALIVLAVPLPAVEQVVRKIAELAPGCPLTDVTSVKGQVAETVAQHAPNPFVGGHPMAGRSASGWSAGDAELFRGAAWVVTADDGTDPALWREVAELALDCGAHVVPTSAAAHDDAVARISHLPHLLAAVLAACGADGGPLAMALAAGSFTDGTRVAGTRPELVLAMCEGNRAALLDAVDDALGRLGAARGALASTGGLRATVTAGHAGRAGLDAHRAHPTCPVTVDLADDEALADLRDLGGAGGRITRVDAGTAYGEMPD
jgi:prephenate dehydrogenase